MPRVERPERPITGQVERLTHCCCLALRPQVHALPFRPPVGIIDSPVPAAVPDGPLAVELVVTLDPRSVGKLVSEVVHGLDRLSHIAGTTRVLQPAAAVWPSATRATRYSIVALDYDSATSRVPLRHDASLCRVEPARSIDPKSSSLPTSGEDPLSWAHSVMQTLGYSELKQVRQTQLDSKRVRDAEAQAAVLMSERLGDLARAAEIILYGPLPNVRRFVVGLGPRPDWKYGADRYKTYLWSYGVDDDGLSLVGVWRDHRRARWTTRPRRSRERSCPCWQATTRGTARAVQTQASRSKRSSGLRAEWPTPNVLGPPGCDRSGASPPAPQPSTRSGRTPRRPRPRQAQRTVGWKAS